MWLSDFGGLQRINERQERKRVFFGRSHHPAPNGKGNGMVLPTAPFSGAVTAFQDKYVSLENVAAMLRVSLPPQQLAGTDEVRSEGVAA